MLQETTPSSMAASRFKIQYLTTALERILFSSLVMVHEVIGSNPAQILYFYHAFIHLLLCTGLCPQDYEIYKKKNTFQNDSVF